MLRNLMLTSTAIFVLLFSAAAEATILTFHIDNPPSSGFMSVTYPDYGDNVNSLTQVSGSNTYNYLEGNGFTPDVTVDYAQGSDANGARYYTDDPDDDNSPGPPNWKDVAFLHGTATTTERKYFFTLTPDLSNPLLGVKINSFDLFRYTGSATQEVTWTIYQDSIGGDVLETAMTGPFNTTIDAPLVVTTSGQLYLGTLVLEVHHTLGGGGTFGMDNLNFDQAAIPEPSTLGLLGIAASCLIIRRNSRRRRAGGLASCADRGECVSLTGSD